MSVALAMPPEILDLRATRNGALTSFSDEVRRLGREPGGETLGFERTLASPSLRRLLGLTPPAVVVTATRLRSADGEPLAIETVSLPAALVPGLEPEDLDDASLYELLRGRFGIELESGRQSVRPTLIEPAEARLLGVPAHSAAFLIERLTRAADGTPVELCTSIYRGDRYRIVA